MTCTSTCDAALVLILRWNSARRERSFKAPLWYVCFLTPLGPPVSLTSFVILILTAWPRLVHLLLHLGFLSHIMRLMLCLLIGFLLCYNYNPFKLKQLPPLPLLRFRSTISYVQWEQLACLFTPSIRPSSLVVRMVRWLCKAASPIMCSAYRGATASWKHSCPSATMWL